MTRILYGKGGIEFDEARYGAGVIESLKNCTSADDFYAQCLATPQDRTIPDQWEAQILARIIRNYTVIVVSRLEMRPIVEAMKMRYAASLDAALAMARRLGKRSLTVIPNGISVVVARQSRPKGPGLGILTAVVLTLAGQVLAQPAVDAGQARKIRVACIGDSITWGGGDDEPGRGMPSRSRRPAGDCGSYRPADIGAAGFLI